MESGDDYKFIVHTTFNYVNLTSKALLTLKEIGPGAMVAAAFIGPGTITTASLAGMKYRYDLLWVVVVATMGTIFLQLMVSKLGALSSLGTGEAIRMKFKDSPWRLLMYVLVICAIFIGNAAYQAGNIIGAGQGLSGLLSTDTGNNSYIYYSIIGLLVFLLLNTGKYKIIEKFLVYMVVLMGVTFFFTAIMVRPDWFAVLKGIFLPKIPENSIFIILGLIGTTIVPYNLFLHANTIKNKWSPSYKSYQKSRLETILSVGGGGLITMFIVITVATIQPNQGAAMDQFRIADIMHQLSPIAGDIGKKLMSSGYFFAGFSSAITAPLAGAIAISEVMNWEQERYSSMRFKSLWFTVLVIGTSIAIFSWSPASVIVMAQFTNAIILPLMVIVIFRLLNDQNIMKQYTNTTKDNMVGILIILIAAVPIIKLIWTWIKI